ncbi:hypothetical protein SPHINGO391_510180 [Sphingomonas aurantiaca]|uniref:Uncharacterized protein n=1 Tax=Sphingomonas aurantiaca TaxID=185949 RepID=A0A5E8AEI4_9SPHN|nr:hypothetical protein SPHINGO391_510180 [Sphingomonas aurantiaca]
MDSQKPTTKRRQPAGRIDEHIETRIARDRHIVLEPRVREHADRGVETSLLDAASPARTSFGREADAYVQGALAPRRPRSSNNEFSTSGPRAGAASKIACSR